jgi:hypothetical protein
MCTKFFLVKRRVHRALTSKVWAPKSSIFTKDATRKNGLWGKNTSHNHVSSMPRLHIWKTTPRKFFGGWCFSNK